MKFIPKFVISSSKSGRRGKRFLGFREVVEIEYKRGGKWSFIHASGEAIDIDTLGSTPNGELFYYIKNNLDFDQLIWEKGDNDNPDWIHVSYVSKKENRGVVLQAWKPKGKSYTLYKYFDLDAETS